MKEQLVSFESAKLAKEKGFKSIGSRYIYNTVPNMGFKLGIPYKVTEQSKHFSTFVNFQENSFDDCYEAPTQSLLQKWLREEHKLFISITTFTVKYTTYTIYKLKDIVDIIYFNARNINDEKSRSDHYDTYEDALEDALINALKLIKE